LHSTVPNFSGRTRFSIDFRTVHIDDVATFRGAHNIDSSCTGTCMNDYLRAPICPTCLRTSVAAYEPGPKALRRALPARAICVTTRRVASASGRTGEAPEAIALLNQVAVVTGAGSGIGRALRAPCRPWRDRVPGWAHADETRKNRRDSHRPQSGRAGDRLEF